MTLENGPLLGGKWRTQTKRTMRKAMMRRWCLRKKKNDDETESNKDEGVTEKSEEVSQNPAYVM